MVGCHDMTNGGNPSDVEYSVSLQFPDFLCDLVKLQVEPRVSICRPHHKGHIERSQNQQIKCLNLFPVQTTRPFRK